MKEDTGLFRNTGGIYVHIPFCRRKCIYCDFYSIGVVRANWTSYLGALLKELKHRIDELSDISKVTLYIGGGTPSLIPEEDFLSLSNEIKGVLEKREIEISEFTIEVNPDDVSKSKVKVWKESGVNRVSMGVQSLVDSELEIIGRRHDSKCAIDAYTALRSQFDNISLDLIFGLPGQDISSLEHTLDGIIKMKPEHISAYSLMFEERAAITAMRANGKIKESPEETSVDMFRLINKRLSKAGYQRYEISNYSLPGFHSKHNSGYWNNIPYIGIGAGAHSYNGKNLRKWNIADINLYQRYWAGENIPEIIKAEELNEDEMREEMIMTRLRTSGGLNLEEFFKRFGKPAHDRLIRESKSFIESGMVEIKENRMFLTEDGVMISDEIISGLF